MLSLLDFLKTKYRIYLITQVDSTSPEEGTHKQARDALKTLIEREVVFEHRVMYCTTQIG